MTTTEEKALNARLRDLYAQRKTWKTCVGLPHLDYMPRCPASRPELLSECEGATCEGCATTLFRADQVNRINAEIRHLQGKPEAAPKARKDHTAKSTPVQLPLFA